MVDNDIHWVSELGNKIDDATQQCFRTGPTYARQNNESGVDILHGNKCSKVPRILRHQNEIVIDTSGQHNMVRSTQPTEVAWMQNNVNALGIQRVCDSRGQTLVEKQSHRLGTAASQSRRCQGLPDGRPRSGCALA